MKSPNIEMSSFGFLSALVLVMSTSSAAVIAAPNNALSGSEVVALLSGNTYQGKHSVRGFDVDMFVSADGTVMEKRGEKLIPGKWSVDGKGRFCWEISTADKRWCRWVVKTGDNEYVKLKDDGKEVRRFKVVEGKAF